MEGKAGMQKNNFQNRTNAEQEERIEQLLQMLTLEEKISMIHGMGVFRTAPVERLGIPSLRMSDGPMGVRQEFLDDDINHPVGYSDDFVSYSLSNSALAATWNTALAYECGRILGEEARGRGKDVILGPGINIKRDPLCGRNFEYMSEDPYLTETLTVPFIKGVQECDVAACVKHFAVNGQETDRFCVDTRVEQRTLREIYFPGFEAAVKKAGTLTLMNAYNRLNGTHCSENKKLLNDILRKEWGYDGVVISDWDSIHTTKGAGEAAIDVEMGCRTDFDEYYFANPLLEAVKKGEVDEEAVNAKVRNVLRLMYRLRMLGEEAPDRKQGCYNTLEHQQGILKAAREAIVLLKNEDKVLPITGERLKPVWKKRAKGEDAVLTAPVKKRIAVIGHNGEHNHAGGGGSAEIKALYEISPLLGLKKALGGNVDIVYEQGYYIPGDKDVNQVNWAEPCKERLIMGKETKVTLKVQEERREIEEQRRIYRERACKLAKTADEVIFIGGLNHDYDTEGRDRSDMKLPYGQDELIEELLAIKPDTVVVMMAGASVEMPWVHKVKALLWCYYSGMAAGDALAEIILGQVNPSGRLPETFPVSYQDTPAGRNGQFGREGEIVLEEGIFVGYRHYEKEKIQPAFAFGHGLSYTEFTMEKLRVWQQNNVSEALAEDAPLVVAELTIKNTGNTAGAEVVQCYVSDKESQAIRPLKELKAYQKVFLEPGEEKQIRLPFTYRAFAYYGEQEQDWVLEPGSFELHIGNSSADCTLHARVEIV